MLLICNTKCTQIVYEHRCAFPSFIHYGMVVESTNYKDLVKDAFEEFSPSRFMDKNHVILIRQYALGDLFQLVHVARRMKEHYRINKLSIMTSCDYLQGLQDCFPDLNFIPYHTAVQVTADVIMMLDGNLEKDHSLTNTENQIHRINIFNRNLEIPLVSKTTSEEWRFSPGGIKFEGESGMQYVGLQIRGSSPIKTLPYDYVVELAKELAKKYKVVLLDHDKKKGFEGENIINTCGKLDVQQCVTLLSNLSAVITMDSGMLWMAHAASIPTICLLGSTREEERVSLHPLYPEKARSISLSNMVNCKPCFETRVSCKGKHTCMNNFPRSELTDKISGMLNSILNSTIGEKSDGKDEQEGYREAVAG